MSIATPGLWAATIGGILLLLVLDFVVTRRPHAVSMREALAWSAFYLAVPLAFGAGIWAVHGSGTGLEFYAGYLVEKSLSIDNLFVFMILLASFAVPSALQQRVLLFGVAAALVLRGVFIALGAQLIAHVSFAFLLFGLVLAATAVHVLREALSDEEPGPRDVSQLRIVRLVRRVVPVTDDYRGTRLTDRVAGRRALTPLGLVVLAVVGTDVVFAVDSVPAVFGITGDAYLVFATNAFALLGLRALYFVLQWALGALAHLGYGLATILGFIALKLVLHWAHGIWPAVPEIPTLASLAVILGVLATVVVTSTVARRRSDRAATVER